MDQLKRIAFTLLLALAVFPLSAQQDKVVDSEAYLFPLHRGQGHVLFSLERQRQGIGTATGRHREEPRGHRVRLDVPVRGEPLHQRSNGTIRLRGEDPSQPGEIELITRGKVKEVHFVTDKKCPESYKTEDGEPRNVGNRAPPRGRGGGG